MGTNRLRHLSCWKRAASKRSFAAGRGARGGCTEQRIAPERKHSRGFAGEQVEVRRRAFWKAYLATPSRGCQGRRYHFPHGEQCAFTSEESLPSCDLRSNLHAIRGQVCAAGLLQAFQVPQTAGRPMPRPCVAPDTAPLCILHYLTPVYMRCPT